MTSSVIWNFTHQGVRGIVTSNGTSLGAFTNISPSYTLDPSSITYSSVTPTTATIDIGTIGVSFVVIDSSGINQTILDYFATLPSFKVGIGSLKITSVGYANNTLALKYNGGLVFKEDSLSSNTLNETISGLLQLPNFKNSDPNDLPTYIQNNLEFATFNNYTLTDSDTFAIRYTTSLIVGRAFNFLTSASLPATPVAPPALPDLTISQTASPQIVIGSQAVTFTLTVSNIGAASVSNITVSDALPSGLTFFTATATGGFNTPSATDASGNLNFTGGTLAPGASATLTVVVTTPGNIPTTGFTNTATVDPLNAIAESNETNNTASANIGVIMQASPPPIGEPLPKAVPLKPPTTLIPAGFVSPTAIELSSPNTKLESRAIEGTSGNDTLTGGSGDDSVRGRAGDDFIYGYGGNNLLVGGRGNDVIFGGKGSNTLIGVSPTSPNPGRGEKDILTGGPGAALFVLGDSQNPYYDDGNNADLGLNDYALINDFNLAKDKIQLKAGLNYLISSSPNGLSSGAGIYIDNDGIPGLSANDELIGLLRGISPNDSATIVSRFSFVGS